jgi:predicted membrane chloride channel (bestrophin family)
MRSIVAPKTDPKKPQKKKIQPYIPTSDYELISEIAAKQNRKPANLAALILMNWCEARRREKG